MFLEFDGDEGKLAVNALWITSVIPISDNKTKFNIARKIAERQVIETDEHSIEMPYAEFMTLIHRALQSARPPEKLTLG